MFHYVYKITNLLNKKIYIGVHSTESLDDDYMGSSKPLSKDLGIYGRDNFKKEILKIFNSRKEALEMEAELVNTDFILRDDTYNINEGGRTNTTGLVPVRDKEGNTFMCSKRDSKYISGEYTHVIKGHKYNFTQEEREKRANRISRVNSNTRKVTDGIHNRSIKACRAEEFLKDNPNWYYGQTQHWTEESKYRASHSGKHRDIIEHAAYKREHIEEIREQRRREKEKIIKPKMVWVTDGTINKKINASDLNIFLASNDSFRRGITSTLSQQGKDKISDAGHRNKYKTNIILDGKRTKVFTKDLYKYPNATIGWNNSKYESNKICQLNKEGEILHRWSALSDIKRSLNIDPDTISLFLRHKREGLYKGYRWVLESEL